jgi:Transglutaminase-like superfamily
MWEAYQRYRALDPTARRLFRAAVVLLLLIRASLRSRGFKKTQQWLLARLQALAGPPSVAPCGDSECVTRTCRMVKAGGHYGLIRPTCLEESLALWYFLRQRGISPQLRIGVRKTDGKFEAHAWVEYRGEILNQSEAVHQHYAAFDSEFSDLPGESL